MSVVLFVRSYKEPCSRCYGVRLEKCPLSSDGEHPWSFIEHDSPHYKMCCLVIKRIGVVEVRSVGCVQIPQGSETKDSGKANIEDNHNT
jgi:hypothetical protein